MKRKGEGWKVWIGERGLKLVLQSRRDHCLVVSVVVVIVVVVSVVVVVVGKRLVWD